MHGAYLNSKIFGFNHLHELANSLDPKQTKLTFWIEVWKRCTFGERIHSGQFRVDRRQTEGYFKNFRIHVDGALTSGGSRWGAGGPPPPILRPIKFFLSPSPPPPYLRIWMTGWAPLQFEGLNPPLLRYGKTRNKKRATCFATLLENELNNDVARFTSHKNKSCNLICCETG